MSLTFTKKQLYIEARAMKKADCPRISKYNKQQLIDYLGEGRMGIIKNSVIKKLKVSQYLQDRLKDFNDAPNKQEKKLIREEVLYDSGDDAQAWYDYNDTSDDNKTRALSSIVKTKKLSDDDLITLFFVMSLLKIPKSKKNNFVKVGKSRGIFNFIRRFIPAPRVV